MPSKVDQKQTTLYSLRNGLKKRPRDASEEEEKTATKRSRDEDALPANPLGGTTTRDGELLPVTRKEFLDDYRVDGMHDVYYNADWIPPSLANEWRRELDELLEWYRPKLRVYGREIQQSRSIAAFSTAPGLTLKYSGHDVEMHAPFPPLLEHIAARLSTDACLGENVKFNHAMLNRYEDGSVYIGKHSDNIENKVIVTVSLGAERTWIMEEKRPRGAPKTGPAPKKHRWTLANGSLLVMQGDVQRSYTHEIPKEAKVRSPRISITFRQLVY